MNQAMKYTYLLTAILCIAIHPLSAGEFRTLCFFGSGTAKEVHHLENATITKTDLPTKNFSKSYQFTAGVPILFGRPNPEEAGTLIPYLAVTPPAGVQDLILLFFPTEDPEAPLKVIPIDGSWNEFKRGELMFLNVSSMNVSAVLGKTRFILESGTPKKISGPEPDDKDGDYYYVTIRSQEKKSWRPLYKGYWPLDEKVRRFVFVFDDTKNDTVRLMGVPDRYRE